MPVKPLMPGVRNLSGKISEIGNRSPWCDDIFHNHTIWMIGLLGVSQPLNAQILFPVDIGHFGPCMAAEKLVHGRIKARNFRIGLFNVNNGDLRV